MTKKATPEAYKRINDAVKEYLDHVNRDTALMINGEWGSGKTYYVKHELENVDPNRKFIYVSLNGLANTEEIDTRLLRAFFRIEKKWLIAVVAWINRRKAALASIGMAIGSAYIVDFVATTMPPLFLSCISRKTIIVFDDLERISNIEKLPAILGYINSQYIEGQHVKVIFVCCQEHIHDNKSYKIIKEKSIYRTIDFQGDTSYMTENFIDMYKTNSEHTYYSMFAPIQGDIVEYLRKVDIINLRIIQTVLDTYNCLFDTFPPNTDNTTRLEVFKTIAAFLNELMEGRIDPHDERTFEKYENIHQTMMGMYNKRTDEYDEYERAFDIFMKRYLVDQKIYEFSSISLMKYMFRFEKDIDNIKNDIIQYMRARTPWMIALDNVYNIHLCDNEEEVISTILSIKPYIDFDHFRRSELRGILSIIDQVEQTGIVNDEFVQIVDSIKKLIEEEIRSCTSIEELEERADSVCRGGASDKYSIWIVERMDTQIAYLKSLPNHNSLTVFLEYLSKGARLIKEALDIFSRNQIFDQIIEQDRLNEIVDLNAVEIKSLMHVVQSDILSIRSVQKIYIDQLESLQKIIEYVEGHLSDDRWKKSLQLELCETLKNALSHIQTIFE